ncbi:efflux RND transporter periplasmic adaptor subunit [Mariprofundus sp. EBB-1]|uniref:efflux RND transporter periplasmic adaptor subunit n=1 Tax=Mariprofundus sp. EBB-1 TaxID=2650971 RepID=UPI00137AED88|nr:efflux RND transporter periplasmic adaptor subunit [Mariprofundus sp. EBB-1]
MLVFISSTVNAAEHGRDHGVQASEGQSHGDHEEGGLIKLSQAQIKQAGIVTEALQMQAEMKTVTAPGTVAFNAYALADITTLVDAVVYGRHVRLGDQVKKGQKLVTLNSTALAQAEANYIKTHAEHTRSKQELARLKKLAQQKIVSQARLQQVKSTYQAMHANLAAARATLYSYGLSKADITSLLKQEVYGLLTLRAPHAGTVVADDFRIGQHLSAGTRLMQIVDESQVWVEVKIPETQLSQIHVGQTASVNPKGTKEHYQGAVINIHHQLDAITRTAGVRLNIHNIRDQLHPGMFVSAEIGTSSGQPSLLVSEHAVQRQGSELIVFVEEEAGHFERREVETGKASMGMVSILKGVKPGESVVVKGAFVLASELAKAGFEVHNH